MAANILILVLVLAWDVYPEPVDGYRVTMGAETFTVGNVTTLTIPNLASGEHTFTVQAFRGEEVSPISAPLVTRSFRLLTLYSLDLQTWQEQCTVIKHVAASQLQGFFKTEIRSP